MMAECSQRILVANKEANNPFKSDLLGFLHLLVASDNKKV